MRNWENEENLDYQRKGVDCWVSSPVWSNRLAVEEKIREGVSGGWGDWSDVFLEYSSGSMPGWIEKPDALTGVLLYVLPSRALVLPWTALFHTWQQRSDRWKTLGKAKENGFSLQSGRNAEYTSRGVAVPISILLEAVPGSLEVLRFP